MLLRNLIESIKLNFWKWEIEAALFTWEVGVIASTLLDQADFSGKLLTGNYSNQNRLLSRLNVLQFKAVDLYEFFGLITTSFLELKLKLDIN